MNLPQEERAALNRAIEKLAGLPDARHDRVLLQSLRDRLDAAESVGEVRDMKYNAVRFYREPNDPVREYLQPGTELFTAPPAPAAQQVPNELRDAVNALLHQIDIGDFVDSHGHSAKMLKPVHDLMRLLAAATRNEQGGE